MVAEVLNNKANKQLTNAMTNSNVVEQKKDVPVSKKDSSIGLRIPGSNWQMFKTLVTATTCETNGTERKGRKDKRYRKRTEESNEPAAKQQIQQQPSETEKKKNEKNMEFTKLLTKEVAMDCEMVGIGDGNDSMIARVSIVNRHGFCVYDKYVKPTEPVKDYRTAVSGIRPQHIQNGQDFKVIQKEVSEILHGRILVGHAIHNDLAVLFLSHPRRFQRDTSRYKVFRKVTRGNTPSLKRLASEFLGSEIQSGEHNSIEDARATMQLYQLFRKKWENDIRSKKQILI